MSTFSDPPNSDPASLSRWAGPEGDQATQGSGLLLFHRYQVQRELGRGGMGVVVLAHDTALDIPVAVKLVPDTVVKDTEAIADLRKEVLRGMALMHPGVVRTTNFERDEGGAGVVMEYIEGDTLGALKQHQSQNCFDPQQILPWIEQLCAVLDYAHREAHIIHRDLKPRNVMVNKSGKLKVADFGIAATISDSVSRNSMEGVTSGTPSYMSPQQAQGMKPSHLDDIHALGATIYELLTSKPPFFRGNATAIFGQVLQVVPPSMAERRQELEITGKALITPAWEETIAACLAKDPAERPQSAGEVLARLRGGARVSHRVVSNTGGRPDEEEFCETQAAVGEVLTKPASAPLRPAPARVTPAPRTISSPESAAPGSRQLRVSPWVWLMVLLVPGVFALWMTFGGGMSQRDIASRSVASRRSATPAPVPPSETLKTASKDAPFVNSLGMEFVPVPGTNVLFCRWETRVKDFAAFIAESGYDMSKGEKAYTLEGNDWKQAGGDWRNPHFKQDEMHPVVCVSWDDAKAYCAWLSKKEGREYRLPTDHEWSCAAGVGDREDERALPVDKNGKLGHVYPWGNHWPPPNGVGNYSDAATNSKHPQWGGIPGGYRDGFAETAPVGSFPKNSYGIYDHGGNIWEWCEDWSDNGRSNRVLRGASWSSNGLVTLRTACRKFCRPTFRNDDHGFRCVLVVSEGKAPHVTPNGAPTTPLPTTASSAASSASFKAATKDKPFVNSLGMEFVPVPGTNVLFGRWETRVKDYAEYAKEKGITPEKPSFEQGPTHPVVNVSWEDAKAFCEWLSKKDGREYRIPTDYEWSCAVGVGDMEDRNALPKDKHTPAWAVFPWGVQWPPPNAAGNYLETTAKSDMRGLVLEYYQDGFAQTSPVGSFAANSNGIYDLSGNAWEWCEDWYDNAQQGRVLRGASWADNQAGVLRSSFRNPGRPMGRDSKHGFRCVVVSEGKAPQVTPNGAAQQATPLPITAKSAAPSASLKAATKDKPFVNSLGMEFIPVPGTNVLFCQWETRVKDYAEYAKEKDFTPQNPGFEQGPTHPVVNVTWEDAKAFCEWLSKKEGREYRLPTDHEWSCAVGIGDREDPRATPKEKSGKIGGVYPWGAQWPPPDGAGNFSGAESKSKSTSGPLPGYRDNFGETAPVGSYPVNRFGIYDLSGNVEEWCDGWYDSDQTGRISRGGSWYFSTEFSLRSSSRYSRPPKNHSYYHGFRCVLVNITVPPVVPLKAATKEAPFVDSLGMEFVPVPGTNVLFGRWETRVKDYAEYAKENGITPQKPEFEQGPTHPVVNVSWEDAKAFCEWLSKKEGREYRLPTDHEWSCAVGIGDREDPRATPSDKHGKLGPVYPWGTQCPPPSGSGNFAGSDSNQQRLSTGVIADYRDGFAATAPVGSFQASAYGICDLSGNVMEWCEDQYGSEQNERVIRGASWFFSSSFSLRSSAREKRPMSNRSFEIGFRCVLVLTAQ